MQGREEWERRLASRFDWVLGGTGAGGGVGWAASKAPPGEVDGEVVLKRTPKVTAGASTGCARRSQLALP